MTLWTFYGIRLPLNGNDHQNSSFLWLLWCFYVHIYIQAEGNAHDSIPIRERNFIQTYGRVILTAHVDLLACFLDSLAEW